MPALFFSPDVSAFASVAMVEGFYVGRVSCLQGRKALKVVHECLCYRDTYAEAERDANRDAAALVRMWADKVRI